MGQIYDDAKEVYRAFATDSVPASGPNEPSKTDIIGLFKIIDNLVGGAISGATPYATASALPASTGSGKIYLVTSDPTTANNGYWQDQGGGNVILTALNAALKGPAGLLSAASTSDMQGGTRNDVSATPLNLSAIGLTAALAAMPPRNELAAGLGVVLPTLFTAAQLDFTDLTGVTQVSGATLAVATSNGLPCLRLSAAAGGTNPKGIYWTFPISAFGGASSLSASLEVVAVNTATNTPAYARWLVQQFNGAAEITASRQLANVATNTGLSSPSRFRFENIAIDPSCTSVRFYLDIDGSASARTFDFRDMMLAPGPNGGFRRPDPQSGINLINSKRAVAYSPNLYTDPEYQQLSAGQTQGWTNGTLTAETKNGALALKTPGAGTATALISPYSFPVSLFPSGRMSVSTVVRAKDDTTLPANLRFRLCGVNSAGTIITTGTWPLAGNDVETGQNNQYYDRNISSAAITSPTTVVVAENIDISSIIAAAGVVAIQLRIREQTTGHMWFSHLNVRDGLDPAYVPPRSSPTSASTAPVLLSATSVPDGAQGQNPNGGFTITGLSKIGPTGFWSGCWVAGNDGRIGPDSSTDPSKAVQNCSIVILSPDRRRIVREFSISGNPSSFPSAGSIQGDAWLSDDTIAFADQGANKIYIIDMTGAKVATIDPTTITGWTAGHICNGIAAGPIVSGNKTLWVGEYTTQKVYLISLASGNAVLRTLSTALAADHDQLGYDATRDYLYYSRGNNGANGEVHVVNGTTGVEIGAFTNLELSQAIEGCYIDFDKLRLFTTNDGGYHAAAKPPLDLICEYSIPKIG